MKLTILLSLLAVASGLQEARPPSQIQIAQVSMKLEDGLQLATYLDGNGFLTFLNSLPARCGSYLEAVRPMDSLLLTTTTPAEAADVAKLKSTYLRIRRQLVKYGKVFYDVRREISWPSMHADLPNIQRSLLSQCRERLRASEFAFGSTRRRLESAQVQGVAKTNVSESLDVLYESIVKNVRDPSRNLFQASSVFTQRHRKKVRIFMKGLLRLLLNGVQLQLSTCSDSDSGRILGLWRPRFYEIVRRMRIVDQDLELLAHAQVGKDVDALALRHRNSDNSQFATVLYSHLTDKFFWKVWLVLVYNDIRGFENHAVSVCGGHTRFSHHGRNLIVASADTKSSFTVSQTDRLLDDIDFQRPHHAGDWMKFLKSRTGHGCSPYAFRGFFSSKCSLSVKAATGRLVERDLTAVETSCQFLWFSYSCNQHSKIKAVLFG